MNALVTGGAGFIGSHLADALVARGDQVRVLDNLATGRRANLHADVEFVDGSVADADAVARAVEDVEVVFHLGALGAVARSVADPRASNDANVNGTLNVLTLARDAGARRVVFASSSSVYGGAEIVPTPESAPLRPRSPYAVTKLTGDWYTRVFSELYDLETVVLRYFNVFGPRQRPDSTYAAVIPLFAAALLAGESPVVHGDGLVLEDEVGEPRPLLIQEVENLVLLVPLAALHVQGDDDQALGGELAVQLHRVREFRPARASAQEPAVDQHHLPLLSRDERVQFGHGDGLQFDGDVAGRRRGRAGAAADDEGHGEDRRGERETHEGDLRKGWKYHRPHRAAGQFFRNESPAFSSRIVTTG